MANEIKDKYSASAALTITLASLANGSARQSTLVDNTTARYQQVVVFYKITQGTSPTGNRSVRFYLVRSDNDATTEHRDFAAGTADAAWTVAPNAIPVHQAANRASPATGDVLQGSFIVDLPGPEWAIAVENDTGVALNSTGGNHWVRYVGVTPEVQ